MIPRTQQPFSPEPLPAGTRIACRIEYDGRLFNGWQAQPHPGTRTVQQALEKAISQIANGPVRVHCAGRTDTGVHGHAQIVHFDSPTTRSAKAWVLGVNAALPTDVRVHWAVPVASDFHARFSAQARSYRYIIVNTVVRPALLVGLVSWCRWPLCTDSMHTAAQALVGEQDFSAFRAASCQSESAFRCVSRVSVARRGDLVIIDIEANAFLHHMVRNIAGSLMVVGHGRHPPEWIGQLLASGDRARAGDTAAADGLYLVDVTYPPVYGLPETPPGPLLLAG